MWVLLNDAFLSIVAHPERSKLLVVRARLEQDIRNVFPDARIVALPNRDYQFRCTVKRAAVQRAMVREVARIDYTNFKDSVPDRQRHDLYLQVWTVMSRLARRTFSRSDDLRWDTTAWGLPLEDDHYAESYAAESRPLETGEDTQPKATRGAAGTGTGNVAGTVPEMPRPAAPLTTGTGAVTGLLGTPAGIVGWLEKCVKVRATHPEPKPPAAWRVREDERYWSED